jgi:nucleotide-binding universal stress UspA family protein
MAVEQIAGVAVENVAVATDFSECSEHAMQHAMAVARHFGATLHLLHLVRPSQWAFVPEMMPAIDEVADRDCNQLVERLTQGHQLDGIRFRRWVVQGEIAEVARDFVREQHIDLLIVGTHGRGGLPRLLLGSVAQQIFHYVTCPVVTVGPRSPGAGEHLQLKRVLFATDLSAESLAGVPYLLTAVEEWHAALDVVHVCRSRRSDHAALLEELRGRLENSLEGKGVGPVGCHLMEGKPVVAVIDFAGRQHEDLIVLGLKAQRALYSGPLWSHAYEIVRHAPCPVLSVRAGG